MDKKINDNENQGSFFVVIILVGLAIAIAGVAVFAVKKMYFPDKVIFINSENIMYVGDVKVMPAKTQPEVKNSELFYKSSDESVATVTQNGVITAVGVGTVEITAEHSFSKKTGVLELTIKEDALRIEIPEEQATIYEGEQISMKPVVRSTGFNVVNLVYSSENEGVAQINSDGIITAVDAGKTVVRVTDTNSGEKAEMEITVLAAIESLSFRNMSVEIYVGKTYQPDLIFTPEDTSDKRIEYSISPETIATVDKNGKVTGVSGGAAVMTATHVLTGKTAKMRINVIEKASKVTLNKTQLLVSQGDTENVLATVLPATAKDKTLKWTSSDRSVAIVAVSGAGTANIKGVSAGTCKIRATSNSNPEVYAELLVTVEANEKHTIKNETYINGILVVNKTYGLPDDYNEGGGLTAQTKSAFAEMKKAAAEEGIDLRIVSGYRSFEYQKELYNSYMNRPNQTQEDVEKYSARPGYSEHQTGLAIDVNNASDSFLGTPEQKWLEQNCVKYGFIIRYPQNKEDKTGYKYEPWHIRYLGKETAQKVYESGLCLEEYLGITSQYSY